MSNLDKKHIEIFREYFLSGNEDIRRNIKNILPGILLKYLSIIETGFSENSSVENIASQIEANHLIPELKQLQSDYYSSLDQMFEEELAFAIRATERESLKKKFESIDSEEEFQLDDSDIKSAIKQVERASIKQNFENIDAETQIEKKPPASVISFGRIIKYAAAAAVIGIVFFGGYLVFNNNKEQKGGDIVRNENKKDSLSTEIANNLPTITEQVSEKRLLVPESFGFAKNEPKYFIVVTQNIEKQIDTLKKVYSYEIQAKNGTGYGPIAKAISRQIDSLVTIRNTYSFDVANKKIIVALGNNQKVDNIISTDPSQKDKIFIKIGKDYYQLKSTTMPLKLTPVNSRDTIEELEKVIFQNS